MDKPIESKYWSFVCSGRHEFYHNKGLTRLSSKNYGIFSYWKICKNQVEGYVEYRVPVSEAMIITFCGSINFVGTPVNKQKQIVPEGYTAEYENMEYHRYECEQCGSLCFDKMNFYHLISNHHS